MASVRSIEDALRNPTPGEPPWGIALLYGQQGSWSEEEFLALETNILVEFVDGCLEFPPIPTKAHPWTVGFLYRVLFEAIDGQRLGEVYHAPYRVKISDRYREPDIVCILNPHSKFAEQKFTHAADLVVEVVSEDDPDRDWVTKRAEYAAAGISEYWIADPGDRTLTIFTLNPGTTIYREAGKYHEGESAASVLLAGLTVNVAAAFERR